MRRAINVVALFACCKSCAKKAEPIETLFAAWTRGGPRNRAGARNPLAEWATFGGYTWKRSNLAAVDILNFVRWGGRSIRALAIGLLQQIVTLGDG